MMNLLPKSVSAPSNLSKMSNDTYLVHVDGNVHKDDFEPLPSLSSALRPLIDDNILTQAATQRIPQNEHFTDRDYQTLHVCNITFGSIIDPKLWLFSFDLWIKHKSKWHYHTFTMNRDNFKQLDYNITINENNSGNFYILCARIKNKICLYIH